MPGQRGKGTQLGPIPRFCPSRVSSSSVNLGIAAWKSLLDVGYFFTVEEEHPVVFRASSDSAVSQLTGWNTYSDLEKLGSKPFSIKRVIPGDESTVSFALKIVAQNPHFVLQSGVSVAVPGFVLHGDVHVSFPDVVLRGFKHKFAPTQSNLRWEGSSRVLS